MNNVQKPEPKKQIKSGLIRWNVLVPLIVFLALIFFYFNLFFDGHIRSAMEWAGYKVLGTETNIGSFKSSFFKGRVEISKIELTSAEKPTHNSLEIGSIRFDLNWDALLRLKFVIEEMSVESIQLMSARSRPGKVAPPEPPSKEDGPSFVDQLQGKAIDKVEKDYTDNVLGDIAGFLKSGDADAQLKNIENTLASKKMAEDLKVKWTDKQKTWDQTIKTLPTENDLKSFKERFDKIKFSGFKTPQEVEQSISQFNQLKADVDTKVKLVEETKKNLDTDLKSLQTDYTGLEKQIKTDIDQIKTRFKIPKIDAGQMAKSLFMQYLTPYMAKLDRYKSMAQKYLPPKFAKKLDGKKDPSAQQEDDDTLQVHPREKGISYEFPKTNGYPLFWIQTVKISSTSNKLADYGDITGTIKNITSNQKQIGKETTLDIIGNFKSKSLFDLKLSAAFNNMKTESEVRFDFGIGQYPLSQIDLIKSDDGQIFIPQSKNSLSVTGQSIGFKKYNLVLKNIFKDIQFQTSAKDKIVDDILKQTFAPINTFDLNANMNGELPQLNVGISSSLGQQLEKSFSALLQKKIDEVNLQIKKSVDLEIGKIKKQIDDQVNGFKSSLTNEVNKAQQQLDQQKKQADERIALAKKDLENQAKGKVEKEGQKALDDLKKKLGF